MLIPPLLFMITASNNLKQSIKEKANELGFILAGVTTPEPPPHYATFENWLTQNQHGTMEYLTTERSRTRRADPNCLNQTSAVALALVSRGVRANTPLNSS